MNFIKKMYRYYCPNWIRKIYRAIRFRHEYKKFKKWTETSEVILGEQEKKYIMKNKLVDVIPYKWTGTYRARNYKVHKNENGYYCTLPGNKKLYLPETAANGSNSDMIALVMAEQDPRSPHLYFDDDVSVSKGCVLFDIGAAEGLITLLHIEKVKKAYVFECDENWIGPLRKTFEPYGNKVSIINKYVSAKNDKYNTTLEPYLEKHKEDSVIIKMDIEGMEKEVLSNALGDYMGRDNIKFSCCTYHRANDAEELEEIFEKNGYNTKLSDGYMLFMNEEPYLRRGIIRAWK